MLKRIGKEVLKILFKKPSNRELQNFFYDEEMRRAIDREWVWHIKSFSDPHAPPFMPDDPSNDFF